jgi:hypothetical protein
LSRTGANDVGLGFRSGCAIYVEQMGQTIALIGDLREDDVSPAAQNQLLQAFRDWKHGP